MLATSLAWNPRTSRKMSTASWRRRQDLQGGHERQGDGFGLLVAGLRAERHLDPTLQQGVGKRLQPYDLAQPGRLRRFNPRHVPLLSRAPAVAARRASRHRLVAIRYSQVRSEARP